MKKEQMGQEYYSIDLSHILKTLLKRAWVLILSGLLCASIGFCVAAFVIAPKYSSSILLYVNNSSFSLGGTSFSISSSEISAAQSLVKTYIVMLQNRTTLRDVIERSDVSYTYSQLSGMIEASAENDTEVMRVTVTSVDPYEAAKIANAIAEVLPRRIAEIIDGASMQVVDSAVPDLQKVSPSITNYTAVGLILGMIFATVVLVISAIRDDTIHDEDYIIQNYDYPILAKIPDLMTIDSKPYGYYSQSRRRRQ